MRRGGLCGVRGGRRTVPSTGCGGSSGDGDDGGAGGDATVPNDAAAADADADGAGDDASPTDARGDDDGAITDGGAHHAALPIKHVIFLVKENRTFDNYFGKFPNANGATTGRISDGGTLPLGPMPDKIAPDISHAWKAAETAYGDGGMDGFDVIAGALGGSNNYVQASRADIPNYWALAEQFVSDSFFSSLHGPSQSRPRR